MRILVCGGRWFGEMPKGVPFGAPEWNEHRRRIAEDVALLKRVLDDVQDISVVIHGAANGADRHAKKWARAAKIPDEPYPANWYPDGFGRLDKAAGPIRNQRMLDEGKPDLVNSVSGRSRNR